MHHPGPAVVPWNAERDKGEEAREAWRVEADRLLMFAPDCGVTITEGPSPNV
jgi:hypothetical protein